MLINDIKVPERDGCETKVILCTHCDVVSECTHDGHKKNGWCYIFV